MTNKEMYQEAVDYVESNYGYYDGYAGANALSKYVDDKYNVNAADDTHAHNALCEVIEEEELIY